MENPKSTRPALVATLLVLILSGIFHVTPAFAQKENEGASDTLSEITSAIAKLQEDVSATEEAVRSAGQSSENAEAEIDQAIAVAKQVLETVGENGTLAKAIDVAIENTRNEIKEVEREGLGDKEAQSVLAELKAEIEGELDNLYDNKIRMVEAQAIAKKELEKFEKQKRLYQVFARRERFKLANEKLEAVVEGVLSLSTSLSKINSLDKPEAETRPVRE
jgi:outer membrane murein-binding lipoprotein Lpp